MHIQEKITNYPAPFLAGLRDHLRNRKPIRDLSSRGRLLKCSDRYEYEYERWSSRRVRLARLSHRCYLSSVGRPPCTPHRSPLAVPWREPPEKILSIH
ncbi:hypothetical protein Zmor_000745 [Zophobas morio]|uniref:Uncharacterized protein n=1 Tax=Zophobas morio TaxID=2755281 RepID=A0AA38MRN2_9CUCU|nr:hypothetical protein Zmor_000745 [Zophobas morio]